MPEQLHIKILSAGVKAWNDWRKKNPSIKHPDLSGAKFRSMMLRSADLSFANLSGADLRDTNMRHTNLSGARLDGARLYRAYISDAKLQGASFKNAILYETVFADVALSEAKHLTKCIHKGPSVLDYRTIRRSVGLPIEFLRGCGLPDFIIDSAMEPRQKPTKYCSCFISYSNKDKLFATRLYDELQESGVRCWFAPKDIPIGAKFRDAIDEGIRKKEKVLLILSKHAVHSSWVEKEVETTFEEESKRQCVILFPIRLDDYVMNATASWAADIRRTRHIGDFANWQDEVFYREAVKNLLRDLYKN